MSPASDRPDPAVELRRRLDDLQKATERLRAENEAQRSARSAGASRILLVDDQEEVSTFTRVLLTNAGHEVDVVENGAEAVVAAARVDYDLILMDVQMPVMGGVEATRRIREAEGGRRRTPVVALSGLTGAEERRAFADAGIDDLIAKPFRRAALFKKVDDWLSRQPAQEVPKLHADAGATSLDDLRAMMGAEWVDRGLDKLRSQIDQAFAEMPTAPEATELLARRAHALVGVSALLGFVPLSRLCASLQDACRAGGDLRAVWEEARAVALAARAEAAAALESPARRG